MASNTKTNYSCDNCGKKLKTFNNSIDITTSKNESNFGWARLHVNIVLHHGSHNDGETDPADLCKKCVIKLLTDAIKRVKNNERASEGTESSDMKKWND